MLDFLSGFPGDVLAVEAKGEVTEADYRKVLIPAAQLKLREHKHVRLFLHLGPAFTGYTAGAAWEDLKLGVAHWGNWGRIAVVTDVHWIAQAVNIFAPFFHHPVRVFANGEFERAKRWIVEEEMKAA